MLRWFSISAEIREAIWLKVSPMWRMPAMREPHAYAQVALTHAQRGVAQRVHVAPDRQRPQQQRVAVSSRLSTIQAPQVSALSIGSSPGSFTSSHCRGSPGSGMTTVSKSSRIRKPAVSIWRNSFSVGWTWASASSRSSRP